MKIVLLGMRAIRQWCQLEDMIVIGSPAVA